MKIKILASGSTGNAYIISDGHSSLLLDAGIPFKEIQKGCDFRLSALAGCLITHEHNDHSKAGADLMKHSVDIYTSAGTAQLKGWSSHRLHIVKGLDNFKVGTFNIMAFDVKHDSPEPLGFVIYSRPTGDKLLYFTDTFYLKYKFDGLTHILGECNYDPKILMENVSMGEIELVAAKRIMKSHMSIDTLLDMLKANDLIKLRQIYLIHLSERNGNAASFKERVQRLTGAEVYVW
jgi:phosphoribosyl 1,2-cyclic phosphodiesterase